MTPLSPTAAGLEKYVDIPVSLSTGTPEISIPIIEVTGRDLRLPITLSYHAGGFKVGEAASWVGLGWSLNAGGMVGRTIRGQTDDGITYMQNFSGKIGPLNELADCFQLDNLADGAIDGEPDLYFFNFNGFGGKFIQTDEVYLMPKQPLRVEGGPMRNWQVTAPNGDQYLFGNGDEFQEKTLVRGSDVANSSTTAWLLSKIISANGTDTMYFEYKETTHREDVSMSETRAYDMMSQSVGSSPQLRFSNINGSTTTVYGRQLERIRFSQGRVEFESSMLRDDLLPRDNLDPHKPVRLNAIKLYDKKGKIIKHFSLEYNYFSVGNTAAEKRLKLERIVEHSVDPDKPQEAKYHSFTYDEQHMLPSRNSKAQDHWGYFNDAGSNNDTMIPTHRLQDGRVITAANREPHKDAVKANLLTKVTYPTGGYAEYEYEAHDYSFIESNQVEEALVRQTPHTYSAEASKKVSQQAQSELFYIDKEQEVEIFTSVYTQTAGLTAKQTVLANGYLGMLVQVLRGGEGANPEQVAVYHSSDNGTKTLHLTPGWYRVSAVATDSDAYAYIRLTYYTFYSETLKLKLAGGVRVKSTKLHDGIDSSKDVYKHYIYRLTDNAALSSGALSSAPNYSYNYFDWIHVPNTDPCYFKKYAYLAFTSTAQNTSGGGNHIDYREVTVQYGEGGASGKSTYYYTSYFDSPNGQGGRAYPYTAPTDLSWRRGLLTRQMDYGLDGKKKREVLNHYSINIAGRKVFTGYKAVILSEHPCQNPNGCQQNDWDPTEYSQDRYDLISEFQYKDSEQVIDYDQDGAGRFVASSKTYHYDRLPAHTLLTRTEQSIGNGNSMVTKLKYPLDYDIPSGAILAPNARALKQMVDKHIINAVVEKTVWQKTAVGSEVIGGEVTEFKIPNENSAKPMVLPYKLHYLEPTQQTGATAYAESFIGNSDGAYSLLLDSRYAHRVTLEGYDTHGKLAEVLDSDRQRSSCLWDNRHSMPVAVSQNAPVNEIFHDNFDSGPGWSSSTMAFDSGFSRTGRVSGKIAKPTAGEVYVHSNAWLSVSLAAPKRFRYSVWYFSDGPAAEMFLFMKRAGETGYFTYIDRVETQVVGKWVLLVKEFEVPADVTQLNIRLDNNGGGNLWFDDVRLCPSDAQMTTYTYDPLVGMTSATDPNNRTSYYEYDGLGRLRAVKDEEKNTLKTYEYHYKQ